MAFMDKLMFWKKKEDFGGLGDLGDLDKELGMAGETGAPPGGERLGLDMAGEEGIGLGRMPGEAETYAVPPPKAMPGAIPRREGMPPIPTDYEAGRPSLTPSTLEYGRPPYPPTPTPVGPEAYAAHAPSAGVSDIYRVSKDVEILSIKIDSLRSALDSINQRLINMEQTLKERRW